MLFGEGGFLARREPGSPVPAALCRGPGWHEPMDRSPKLVGLAQKPLFNLAHANPA